MRDDNFKDEHRRSEDDLKNLNKNKTNSDYTILFLIVN